MERHFLITIGNDVNQLYGVRFVAYFLRDKSNVRLTLFNVVPDPPAVWAEERSHETLAAEEASFRRNIVKSEHILTECKSILVQHGFQPGSIDTKHAAKGVSRVMTIVQEGEEGLYDAVVLGRRGTMRLEEILDESVSKGVLTEQITFPIWISREPEFGRRNVLLCVDGSAPGERIADQVGFVLADQPGHDVTLCYVSPGAEARAEADEAFASAEAAMVRNGLDRQRISRKILDSARVAPAILREAADQRYAAVAVGRTGRGSGILGKLFMGSVSMALFKELREAALWSCR